MFNVRLAGDHLYGKWLFTWLSLVMSLIGFLCCPFSNEMSWMRSGTEEGFQAGLYVVSAAGPTTGCASIIEHNEEYVRCMQSFSALFENMAEGGSITENATNSVLCSEEGKAALNCVLDYFKRCPELTAGNPDDVIYNTIAVIQISGSVQAHCEIWDEGCMSEFKNCTTLLDPKGGEKVFTHAPDEFKNGPTIYSAMPAQIGILCGPMEVIMTCAYGATQKCPKMIKHIEKILSDKIEDQRAQIWPDFPAYDKAKDYIIDMEKCAPLQNVDFSVKGQCLATSVAKDDFVNCFTNSTDGKTAKCSIFLHGKKCIEEHVEPDCEKTYSDLLIESSYLFSDKISKQCLVSGMSSMQASLFMIIVTGSFLMLWDF